MAAELRGLSDALRALGAAKVFAGDPFTVGGLKEVAKTDGEISVEHNTEYNDFTATEHFGPGVIERKVQGENPTVSLPLILGDPLYWAELAPTGESHAGHSTPQAVQTTSLVIVPLTELNANGTFSYDPAAATPTWDPAAPEHAIWFWRGHFERVSTTFRQEDGGKVVETVTFQAMVDIARPEGHMLYTRGDPVAQGITVAI